MRGVVFFDVDGTLVPTSSSQHLARYLGHLPALARAEDAYAAGLMDNREVSLLDAAGWRDRTSLDIGSFLRDLPLVGGIEEVVAWCREQELAPYLATLAWQPVGDYLRGRFGFEGACGPRLQMVGDRYTGIVSAHFDEFDKRDFAVTVAHSLGVSLSSCAAVGDSRSDLPLFEVVGMSVGFNAGEAVRAVATATADGNDLRAILPLLADWADVE